MEVSTFPFRIDERTHNFLSGVVSSAINNGCRMQSLVQGQCSLLVDKKEGKGLDGNIIFQPDGVVLTYPIRAVAKQDRNSAKWLNNYHSFLQKSRKSVFEPVMPRCIVTVKAFYDGRLEYYLTYMVAYEDESIAQDTPQGALYARDSLSIKRTAAVMNVEEIEEGGVW